MAAHHKHGRNASKALAQGELGESYMGKCTNQLIAHTSAQELSSSAVLAAFLSIAGF